MAVKIGELLVENNLITDTQLAEALKNQKMFGGKLGSNLVDLGYLTEHALSKFLSLQLGMPAVAIGEFDCVPDAVIKTVPAAVAEEHKVVPVGLSGRKLRLAMADPTDIKAIDEVSFLSSCLVIPAVAPEVLISYGLEKYYGIARSTRYIRLTDPSEAEFHVIQTGHEIIASNSEVASQKGVKVESRAAFLEQQRTDFLAPSYGLKEASSDLASVINQKMVIDIIKRFVAQDFKRTAIFVVRQGMLAGWTHVGCAIPEDDFRKLTFPPQESTTLGRALEARVVHIAAISQSPMDNRLISLLGIENRQEILLLPITINNQPIGVLVADGAFRGEAKDRLDDYAILERKTSLALQILVLRKRILET